MREFVYLSYIPGTFTNDPTHFYYHWLDALGASHKV